MTHPPRKPARSRLDVLLVERGLVESREKAQRLILAGSVFVDSQRAAKPGSLVSGDAGIRVAEPMPYVSRGGFKLAAALDRFSIDVRGNTCLDVGASTGGFTDCLLQRGAARVIALDVGHGQLDWKLRNDPRVTVVEETNARYLRPADIGGPVDLVTCDVSFISATLILPALPALMTPAAAIVVLVKPQFEAGRGAVGKGGIVRDAALHKAACDKVAAAAGALGFLVSIMESPIAGAEGNREFLLYARH
jgi:23S rRNA (cytidine1920-2'-O)/16S rRNA (cytidine1409-2'-O)-methyltransferase